MFNYLRTSGCVLLVIFLTVRTNAQQAKIDFRHCKHCVVLAEQSKDRIAILNLDNKEIIWDWQPKDFIPAEQLAWFHLPSEVKPVMGGRYILTTASGGAVSLIRIADKKIVFYAYAGGNTHSAELLPDGNIVSASSDGNYLTVFSVDTLHFPQKVYSKKIWLAFGHNVVWDKKRKLLWAASQNLLKSFSYNFDRDRPDLTVVDSLSLPGTQAHDLFPVYGQQALWLTNSVGLYRYDLKTEKITRVNTLYHDIKSVSSGPGNASTLLTFPEDVKKGWWTDEVNSLDRGVVFKSAGLRIYKARWFVKNTFSY